MQAAFILSPWINPKKSLKIILGLPIGHYKETLKSDGC